MSNIVKKEKNNEGGLSKLKNIQGLAPKISGKIELPRLFYQQVVFVLDGSGSMTFKGKTDKTKAEEVEEAVKKVIERLQKSKNANSFDINIWAFAGDYKEIIKVSPVKSFNNNTNLNPNDYLTYDGRTDIYETLKLVKQNCELYLNENTDKNSQSLIIILSDGELHNWEKTIEIANEIKENKNISISTIFFDSEQMKSALNIDTSEAIGKLKKLASSDAFFKTTADAEEIRKHMIKSISTVSNID